MTIKNILLVDDSKTELHHLNELLTKRGFAVRTAENGEEAWKRLEEAVPDLILTRSGVCGRVHATMSSSRSTPTSC